MCIRDSKKLAVLASIIIVALIASLLILFMNYSPKYNKNNHPEANETKPESDKNSKKLINSAMENKQKPSENQLEKSPKSAQKQESSAENLHGVAIGARYKLDIKPVSYTHLDVYKRQRLEIASGARQLSPANS